MARKKELMTMRTRMTFAALAVSVALRSRAFSAEPSAPAPAVPPVAAPATAPAAAAAPAGDGHIHGWIDREYFKDWHPMRPIQSFLHQLHDVGCAICGDRHCEATANEK